MNSTSILDALPVAVYTTDSDGRITYFNEAAAEFWGRHPEIGKDKWCGSLRLYRPDGRPLRHDECPMAIALREGRPVRGIEAIAERPDGTRIRFLPFPTPLWDDSGRLTGAINLLMDVTDRRNAEFERAQLAAIVTSSDDAIVSKTLDGTITSWNEGASRIFGYEAVEMIGQSIKRIIPPELHAEEDDILARLRRGEHIRHYETTRVAKDGRKLDISVTVSPLRDEDGNIVGASKVARDITERKRAEKLQRLLIDELNHRVKNTLAAIQAIAGQSLRRAKSPGDFVASFGGRIQALALAHDALTKSKLQGAVIKELVQEQVTLGGTDDPRIALSGPFLLLDPQSALHLALVLHELATNARKYGALSVPDGRLAIEWEIHRNGGYRLQMDWKETGGPPVRVPKERGFGSTLIEKTLQSHGGQVTVRYDAEGLSSQIDLPIAEPDSHGFGTYFAIQADQAGLKLIEPIRSESKLKDKRIIIIEDEPVVAMDLEASLESAGCKIIGSVGTLERAKALIAGVECDGALIDVNLGGQPVDELALALTQKRIPFAFVTGYGRSALPTGFRQALMLSKPFGQQQLTATVESLFDQPHGVVSLRQKKQ